MEGGDTEEKGEPWRTSGRPREDPGGVPELARVGDLAGGR
jgi:hypothetical protein